MRNFVVDVSIATLLIAAAFAPMAANAQTQPADQVTISAQELAD